MKTKLLDSKLTTYSTAVGAALLGGAGADAAIQYTAVDLTISDAIGINLDLNGGDNDFFLQKPVNYGVISGLNGAELMASSTSFALNFAFNDVISGSGGASFAAVVMPFANTGEGFMSSLNFSDTQPGYLGFRLNDGGFKYGWMHIDSIAEDGASYHISGYAYEDTGASILAGAEAVPEPSSLALLALGAAGIRSIRRFNRPGA